MQMAQALFEWVLLMSKGEDRILTETQYKFYREHRNDGGNVLFDDFEINPFHVVQAYRRPADEIIKRYPCRKCYTTGQINYKECPDCKGTGVKLP